MYVICDEADGRSVCNQNIHKGEETSSRQTEDGQHHSRGVCEPHGWHQVPKHSRELITSNCRTNCIMCSLIPRPIYGGGKQGCIKWHLLSKVDNRYVIDLLR